MIFRTALSPFDNTAHSDYSRTDLFAMNMVLLSARDVMAVVAYPPGMYILVNCNLRCSYFAVYIYTSLSKI